jgi:ferredoxin
MMKPYLDKKKCPAQKDLCLAIRACPKGAVLYVEDEQDPLGGKIVFDETLCDGCGDCVTACCGQAIALK